MKFYLFEKYNSYFYLLIDSLEKKKGFMMEEEHPIFNLIKGLGDFLFQIAECIETEGFDPNLVKDRLNRSVLHLTASHGTFELFRKFVEDGVDINAIGGVFDRTPLHYACVEGNVEIVSFLIARPGVLINIEDIEGNTPLDLAKLNSHRIIVEMLQEAGAR